MRKKIKTLGDFQLEKERLLMHQNFLEERIQNTWKDLKNSIIPNSNKKETLSNISDPHSEHSDIALSLVKSLITISISVLAGKITNTINSKLDSHFDPK